MLALVGVGLLTGLAYAEDAIDISRLSDPTRPYPSGTAPAVVQEAATGPELQSTTISPTFRRAVISSRSYKQGDKIDGAVITSIQPYEVTLKQDGRETRLRLLPKLTRQPNISAKKPDKDG
ncbi:MAG: hypothetical protein HY082_07880 [Gammaproteobacteria bacterium]|nr:hypothetical protein [Gammaproteobacteria bacterium]